MEEDNPYYTKHIFNRKIRKSDGFLLNDLVKPIAVEVIDKRRSGKCLGASKCDKISPTVHEYNYIGDDIWHHIGEHIDPEDVQRFGLICRQTASVLATATFWTSLYCRHRLHKGASILRLPENLRPEEISGAVGLRAKVVRALFHCYPPFVKKAKFGYKLNTLIGKHYISSWIKQCSNTWMMYYKFIDGYIKRQDIPKTQLPPILGLVEDWESLTMIDSATGFKRQTFVNQDEGIILLIIYCKHYKPLPNYLIYNGEYDNLTLTAARQMLATNLRDINLELDFSNSFGETVSTTTYQSIIKFTILPWWHPDFTMMLSF